MFTGIIETLGTVVGVHREGTNVHLDVESTLAPELRVDQSLAHNGVCLTVVALHGPSGQPTGYRVTAIDETLQKTTVGRWVAGTRVNLERCMPANGRLDGHIVQGHVDAVGRIASMEDRDGSWTYRVEHPVAADWITVPKGSVAVNGTSLTVVDAALDSFSVAIIPYTYEHTVFHTLQVGDPVNLEFDILGKYAAALLQRQAAFAAQAPSRA
jgi:riboflavin synthase